MSEDQKTTVTVEITLRDGRGGGTRAERIGGVSAGRITPIPDDGFWTVANKDSALSVPVKDIVMVRMESA